MTTEEIVALSRAAQGLPEHVEDESTLQRIAALIVDRPDTRGAVSPPPGAVDWGAA